MSTGWMNLMIGGLEGIVPLLDQTNLHCNLLNYLNGWPELIQRLPIEDSLIEDLSSLNQLDGLIKNPIVEITATATQARTGPTRSARMFPAVQQVQYWNHGPTLINTN
ncbi:hypothetical protein BY996DRAFT_6426548 [Phakopsora pachyrhizi]|nr:hypothetical protein BY996DRAFT_6426548 [Phakopsora pachyrhizi]